MSFVSLIIPFLPCFEGPVPFTSRWSTKPANGGYQQMRTKGITRVGEFPPVDACTITGAPGSNYTAIFACIQTKTACSRGRLGMRI
jgi:hypothetical protein